MSKKKSQKNKENDSKEKRTFLRFHFNVEFVQFSWQFFFHGMKQKHPAHIDEEVKLKYQRVQYILDSGVCFFFIFFCDFFYGTDCSPVWMKCVINDMPWIYDMFLFSAAHKIWIIANDYRILRIRMLREWKNTLSTETLNAHDKRA